MMNPFSMGGGEMINVVAFFGPFFILVMVWSLVWKGLALWHSAGRNESVWFTVMLLINTMGILEIIYLFFIAKLKFHNLFSRHHGHHG